MSLFWGLLKKGRFHIVPRLMLLTYAAYWEFPDVALFFQKYANDEERALSLAQEEGVEYRAIWWIRHTHRRLDMRYHWVDRGRLYDIIRTVEHRRFLENYEHAKYTMARNTWHWKHMPGCKYQYMPSFMPMHEDSLPYDSVRYQRQFPIYEMRKVEGVNYDDVPTRLKPYIEAEENGYSF